MWIVDGRESKLGKEAEEGWAEMEEEGEEDEPKWKPRGQSLSRAVGALW